MTELLLVLAGVAGGLGLNVLGNDLHAVVPWATTKIALLAARVDADGQDHVGDIHREFMAGIRTEPPYLPGLGAALGFLFKVALLRRCGEAAVGLRHAVEVRAGLWLERLRDGVFPLVAAPPPGGLLIGGKVGVTIARFVAPVARRACRIGTRLLPWTSRTPATPASQTQEDEPVSLLSDEHNVGGMIEFSSYAPEFGDYAVLPGQVIGGTLTSDERVMVQLMEPRERARHLLRRRIQEKEEMASLLSQLQALRRRNWDDDPNLR